MHRRPLIGITTQTQEPIPGQAPRCWIMGHTYINSLSSQGALPWVIPLVADDLSTLRGIYEQVDGVFLPGGVDVEPVHYGETTSELCGRVDPDRDMVELTLARWAMEDHKPLLGVCRGLQVMNVAAGGSLYQDVLAQRPDAIKHDYYPYHGEYTRDRRSHEVRIEPASRLSRLLGGPQIMVNSMHHQGIKDLAPGLRPTSYAPDGLIESIESPNGHFAVAVQWHPEEFVHNDAPSRRLFQGFLKAASDWQREHEQKAILSMDVWELEA